MKTNNAPRLTIRVPHPAVLALAACSFLVLHSAFFAVRAAAQSRADNRRLVWTGSNGMEWDGSSASWQTSGSFLAYANASPTSAVWHSTDALDETAFLGGDVAIFDSTSDAFVIDPGSGLPVPGDPMVTRTINIASAGVTASDVILSGAGNFVFTGGAITTDAGAVAPGSAQLSGTGAGMAAVNVQPAGRLVKLNTGDLTLSNTAANVFKGGIHIAAGSLTIADNRALGGNNISILLASTATANNIMLPATVTSAGGALLRAGTALISPVTLRVPASADGLDITGDIYLADQTLTLEIEGDTLISGRIVGVANNYGSNGGAITKTGGGTLTISGTTNWFYGVRIANSIEAGRVVATGPYSLGTGVWSVAPGAILEFRGVKGTMKQSFIGGGDVEVTGGSDLTFNWYNGPLEDFESMPSDVQPNNNLLGSITVAGASRFTAMASGTHSSVLGGGSAQVFVRDGSTLVLGREGLSNRGTARTEIPMTYPILTRRVSFTGASTLVLNPNAFLNTGALDFSEDSSIFFGASGVSQIRWQEGTLPEDFNYLLSAGMKLIVNEIPVTNGYYREFVVVNQGANPLNDIAMTLGALDAVHDTLNARLDTDFLDPVTAFRPARGRKWVNGGWARYITSQFDYDNVSITTPGITGRIAGAVLGFDGILPKQSLVGFHAGAMDNNLSTTNDTSLASKQRFLGLHAAQRFGKFYLAVALDTGRVRTDSLRNEPANLVRGKWNTSYYTGAVHVGATFYPWKKLVIRPRAGLRYSKLKIYDHYERGLSPLVIDDFDDTGAQTVLGLSAGWKFNVFKRDLAVDLTLARKQTIRTPRSTLDTHYYDSPKTTVTLGRGDYYSGITAGGVSLRMSMTRQVYAGLAFDYETASTHTRYVVTAMAGCTW